MSGMLRTPLLPSDAEEELPWYRDGAVWGAVGNVSMTMIGTVVLTLPAALATLGWGLGLALLVVFALLSDLSMIFLVHCAANSATTAGVTEDVLLATPPPQQEVVKVGYEQLGTRLLGPGVGIAVRCALLALLGTATITTNIIVIDMTQSNMAAMGLSSRWGWLASRWFLSAVNIGLMFPFTLLAHVGKMRYVSLAAAAATAWVLVAVTAACLTDPHLTQYAAAAPLVVFQPAGVLALPIISLAYCAQFQVIPQYWSLPHESRKHMPAVIHVSTLAIALPIYCLFALLPYLALGPTVSSDFLYAAWQHNHVIISARVLLTVANMLKYPLLTIPLRDLLAVLAWGSTGHSLSFSRRLLLTAHVAPASTCDSDSSSLTQAGAVRIPQIMTVVNASAFGVCLVATDLGQVIDATGASCGSLVCLVFPGLLFYSFRRGKERDTAHAQQGMEGAGDTQSRMAGRVGAHADRHTTGGSSDWGQWLGLGLAAVGLIVGAASQVCALVMPSL